jgi:hypothetical protein
MPDFGPVITLAYMRILGRPPDPGGLENYNRQMNSGLTEAQMRESLLRSPEYATKNPDRLLAAKARRRGSTRKKKRKTR